MQVIEHGDVFPSLCKASGKFGLWLSYQDMGDGPIRDDEVNKAVPFLSTEQVSDLILIGICILCDTEEEMRHLYDQVVGDDGPTEKNTYSGDHRVYAYTVDDNGQIRTENT